MAGPPRLRAQHSCPVCYDGYINRVQISAVLGGGNAYAWWLVTVRLGAPSYIDNVRNSARQCAFKPPQRRRASGLLWSSFIDRSYVLPANVFLSVLVQVLVTLVEVLSLHSV